MQDQPPYFPPPQSPTQKVGEAVELTLPLPAVVVPTPIQSRPAPLPVPPETASERKEERPAAAVKPHPSKGEAAGTGRSRSHPKESERERVSRSYTPAHLSLIELSDEWRKRIPLANTDERARRQLSRALVLFTLEDKFRMTAAEFRQRYLRVGNAADAMAVLITLNEQKLLCFASYSGEFINHPQVDEMSLKHSRVFLTDAGVEVWSRVMVDEYRSFVRADPFISGILTQFLVELPRATVDKKEPKA